MDGSIRREILAAFEASRTRLPRVGEVRARPNVSRLASVSTPRNGRGRTRSLAVLNLSTAVVDAGPEAWRIVAPALEGDRESLRRLRVLTRAGVEANRARRPSPPRGPDLPDTPCHGTPGERRYLLHLIQFVRATSGHAQALPRDIQVRISRRMTSRLGLLSARGGSHRITLSQRLFRPGLEAILWDTVKHELAHLADLVTSPGARTSHGPNWQAWARRLGARPERLCTPEEAKRIRARVHVTSGALAYPREVADWLEGRSAG